MQAVFHKTHKISNVVPLGIPHQTDKNIKLSGLDLSKGPAVSTNVNAIQMNEKILKTPSEFNHYHLIKDGIFEESVHVIEFPAGKIFTYIKSISKLV